MKKFFILTGIVVFAFACSQKEPDNKKDSAASCKADLNPNGDSELAKLMREMAIWTDSVGAAVKGHRSDPPYPESINTIHAAKKTDETIDKKLFDACADLYLQKVKAFLDTPDELDVRTTNYNEMVNACISCHQNFCQGPIKRIRKLLIPTL